MSAHREHPRRGLQRPGLYVMGGVGGDQREDFPSSPLAGGHLEVGPAANLPASAAEDLSAEARRLIAWDQAAAVEPYQVDVTRDLDETVRMGNGLSAAVRLELLADRMREEVLDAPRDPVTGAELDRVDGLPVDELDELDEDEAPTLVLPSPPVFASPRPPAPQEYGEPFPVGPAQAAQVSGVARRMLDWNSVHDPASLAWALRARLPGPAPLVDRLWEHGPILDQGTAPPLNLHDASGCTGHAGVNASNILELATAGPYDKVADIDMMGHADAMKLYDLAQTLDDIPGVEYPGTSVLALMKAGQHMGLWGSYVWAFGTKDIAQALLQVGPVVVGIPWLSGMSAPGPDGIVTVAGDPIGGHALCLFGIRMAINGKAGPWFGALQSWGEGVGDHGRVWFHHKDLAQLLHGTGEAAIPLPKSGGAL